MRRLLAISALLLALTGCGSAKVSYTLSFDTKDTAKQHDLTLRSMKVIERRLQGLGQEPQDEQISTTEGAPKLTVVVADGGTAKVLTQQLTEPFSLNIMKQAPEGSGDIILEQQGGFFKTALTEKSIVSADYATDNQGKGAVKINFTEAGKAAMNALLKESKGKAIGIFVRDRLISKLNVQTDEPQEYIVIRDIPSAEMAEIFADDLNVGLHVIFTPVP